MNNPMSKAELELRVIDFIHEHDLFSPGEAVVIGVSGGPDSVCLLHLLSKRQEELDIRLHVAHLDHGLRGTESEADAIYVGGLAASLSLPITVERQDVAAYKADRGCCMEEAARELRYAFFVKVANEVGAKRVAVGHTLDDQVETVLMHILRGTGTSGLRGLEPCSPMPYSKQKGHCERSEAIQVLVIRPLLKVSREETLHYCQEFDLRPRFDSSNVSLSYLRNRLRLELLPLLREYNPSVDEALLRLAEIARDDSVFIEEQVLGSWNKVARLENGAIYLDRAKTAGLAVALQRQLIRLAIARTLGDIRDIEANHIEAVRSLLSKPVGKKYFLPHGLVCQGEYDEIVIAQNRAIHLEQALSAPHPFLPLQGEISLKVPGETIFPGWRVLANILETPAQTLCLKGRGKGEKGRDFIAEFDLRQTGTELFVRQRRPGDRFQPLGMNMSKKLQEFMVDAKIPLPWRDCVPVVCTPRQIIWVTGYRIDDRVKVTQATKEVLRLEFIRLT